MSDLTEALRKSDFAGYRTGEAADEIDRLTRELAAKDAEIAGLRAKHYEECAVICDELYGLGTSKCARRIRTAAKEKP